uniref:RING-type domain-containing protein n=2 Tax=Steinernema glaseri TaxID=37863 RepID=A0A1I7ZJ93_9BILA
MEFKRPDGAVSLMQCSSTAAAALMMESLVDFCALSEELPFPMEDRSVALSSAPKSDLNGKDSPINEMEYPFLDHKPEIGGRRGVKKGKKNTLETELQRQVANRALLQKRIVVSNGKVLGKRRQARLLSECSDDFSVDVPYSLNRKNRWNVDVSRLVKNAGGTHRVLAVEKHLSVDPSGDEDVTAYHERQADGTEVSKKAKSRRGAKLQTLAPAPTEADNNEASVMYSVMRSDRSLATLSARKVAQNVRLGKGHAEKRREQFDLAVFNEEMSRSIEPEEAEDTETAQQYRPPCVKPVSLYDYIKESAPVLVRSHSIESLDNADHMDELQIVPDQTGPKPFELRSLPAEARRAGIFESFVFDVSQWEPIDIDDLLESFPSFRWVDTQMTSFFVDLTGSLKNRTKSVLVVLIDMRLLQQNQLRVIINGSMESNLSADAFKHAILNDRHNLASLLAAIPEVVLQFSSPEDAKIVPESFSTEVNAERFAFLGRAYNDYQIFSLTDVITKAATVLDTRILECEELEDEGEDDFEEDDFEKIDMDEVLSEESDDDDDVDLVEFVEQCQDCGLRSANDMISIPGCEHTFCRDCLPRTLNVLIRSGALIGCPACSDHPPLPVAVQALVLPMPMVLYHSKLVFKKHVDLLATCPKCASFVVGDPSPDHKHLRCDSCSTNFCGSCAKEPHWPLSCEQAASWMSKFTQQFDLDMRRDGAKPASTIRKKCQCDHLIELPSDQPKATCEMCGLMYDWKSGRMLDSRKNKYTDSRFVLQVVPTAEAPAEEKAPQSNLISAQFSSMCSEMRRARFDFPAARDFEKKCDGFGVNPKEIRKTVLYLIEFGYAWLYMTRNEKPDNWNAVKALLTKLRNTFSAVDEVLHRPSQSAAPKIKSLEKQIEDVIALL